MKNLKGLLFVLQLEEYSLKRFWGWVKQHPSLEVKPEKKRLVWTPKAILVLILALPIYVLSWGKLAWQSLLVANLLVKLIEWPIKAYVVGLAAVKIRMRPKLMIVAITGSYGKTSVREFTVKMLARKYRVYTPPENYNTPLGLSFSILKGLRRKHQVLVAELAAYHRGDIANLCRIVPPKIGVITSIGKQHLERFGSEENILKTKWELAEALPQDGTLVVNGNDSKLSAKIESFAGERVCFGAFGANITGLCSFCSEYKVLKLDESGTKFEFKVDGKRIKAHTPLLGEHNVANVMAAVAVADKLGVSENDILNTIKRLKPPPHRLEVIRGAHDTIILDNSYSSNPDSGQASLKVIANFKDRKKIVVTPGFVELGKQQFEENKRFGKELLEVADEVIVVGKTNREALKAGLGEKAVYVDNLTQAQEKLKQISAPRAVILFENDLPDQYS